MVFITLEELETVPLNVPWIVFVLVLWLVTLKTIFTVVVVLSAEYISLAPLNTNPQELPVMLVELYVSLALMPPERSTKPKTSASVLFEPE